MRILHPLINIPLNNIQEAPQELALAREPPGAVYVVFLEIKVRNRLQNIQLLRQIATFCLRNGQTWQFLPELVE